MGSVGVLECLAAWFVSVQSVQSPVLAMASCSLLTTGKYPLMSRAELETILLFQRVNDDWVREVHMFSSIKKKGMHFVVFRNISNKKLLGLKELQLHLEQQGHDRKFLEQVAFKSDKDPEVVSNKVGANKIAKKEAQDWINEVNKNYIRG